MQKFSKFLHKENTEIGYGVIGVLPTAYFIQNSLDGGAEIVRNTSTFSPGHFSMSSARRIYKGIRKENWIYYLKEMEFRYNNRQCDSDKMVTQLIGLLTQNSRSEVS